VRSLPGGWLRRLRTAVNVAILAAGWVSLPVALRTVFSSGRLGMVLWIWSHFVDEILCVDSDANRSWRRTGLPGTQKEMSVLRSESQWNGRLILCRGTNSCVFAFWDAVSYVGTWLVSVDGGINCSVVLKVML
jgi:hypothetical protein